jgi:hypothetical protein
MGKKSAHTGMSPKDRSINIMDKFISKNANRAKNQPVLSARRKDPNIPIHMWPLKDQIEYWDSRTSADWFDDKYPAYSFWIKEVQQESRVHPTFFTDCALRLKSELTEMFEQKTGIKEAVRELRKHGVY